MFALVELSPAIDLSPKTGRHFDSPSSLFQPFDGDSTSFDDYPEEDSRQFISMLTKCLGLMNKVPEAIEVIRDRCDREFINIVIKTAQEVLVTSGGGSISVGNGAGTRSNSFLDISSIGSDSLGNSTFETAKNSYFGGGGSQYSGHHHRHHGQQHIQAVLSCTTLLGHVYNGYSHLLPPSLARNAALNSQTLQLSKCSLQLQDFFDLLMRQYRAIVSLHESIVLPNLQKIESGLHAFGDSIADADGGSDASGRSLTNFYSATDLWAKVQSLVQQLLEFFLDSSNLTHHHHPHHHHLNQGGNSLNLLFSHASILSSAGHGVSSAANALSGHADNQLPTDYSSYFVKRRPLVGAMNAMNVMSKNTLNAVVNTAAGGGGGGSGNAPNELSNNQSSSTLTGHGASNSSGTLMHSSTNQQNQHSSSSSTANFLSNMVGNSSNSNFSNNSGNRAGPSASLFKFDNSSQAMAWNGFLAEQQQQQSAQLLSPKDSDKKDDKGEGENDQTDQNAFSPTSASVTSPSVIGKLFETLRTISTPSPDNLVIIYETLMKFAQQSPPFTDPELDLDARSIRSLTTSTTSKSSHHQQQSAQLDQYGISINSSNSHLQSYLVSAAEKFAAHINEQLEKMMELAAKSLESGSTVSIAHMSPLTAAFNSLTEVESSSGGELQGNIISKAQQNQHHFAQQQLNSKLYPPLLESAVLVDVATRDLRALMQAMPDYSNIFLGYICNYLSAFKDACTDAYNGIVETTAQAGTASSLGGGGLQSNYPNAMSPNAEGEQQQQQHHHHASSSTSRRIISANWAKDEDITRLLKFLPNWKALDEHQKQSNDASYYHHLQGGPHLIPSIKPSNSRRNFKTSRQMSSFDESPEEIRLRNMKETEILIQTLSQEVRDTDVLSSEKGQFRQLAQMQESFEWTAARCQDLVNSIEAMKEQVDHPGVEQFRQLPDVYIATLNSLALDFAELAETILLMMHLEVRVHCFYNLQQLDSHFFTTPAPPLDLEVQTSRASQEHYSDDPKIFPLLDDLKRMHDEFQRASLKSFKMVYIFEGLDHLIATTFINSVNDVKRVKHLGIKRACRAIYDIQRRLSTITKNRELALDYARQFFELFLTSPEEIMASILERGPTFHTAEYEIVFTLLHQSGLVNSNSVESAHSQNANMEVNLRRLREILNNSSVQI